MNITNLILCFSIAFAISLAATPVVKGIAHKIGAEFHMTHGRINAILLPYVIKYNSSKPTKFVSIKKFRKIKWWMVSNSNEKQQRLGGTLRKTYWEN